MKKKSFNMLYSLLFACSATAVTAQDTDTDTATVIQIVEEMAELHASLNGKTVKMRGAIGTLFGEALYFKNDDGQFSVQFDAGRNARKTIEGCELEFFGWANSNCIVDIEAEITIETVYDFADGGEIKLIIYDVQK
jgi:hypothetical protein